MIKLIQFPPAFGLPNGSPFCLKLETWLRMAGLPYENVYTINPRSAPKGKLPCIEDQGRVIADSGLIVDYLTETYGVRLDAELTPEQRAAALAWQRLFEEHLYWANVHARWADPAGWRVAGPGFFGHLPWPVRPLVAAVARRGLVSQLYGHGLGRHRPEEIYRLGCDDIDAAAAFLGDKPYFLGTGPTTIDAVAYGFLANILLVDLDSPLRRCALSHPNLDAYCRRIRDRYFGPGTSAQRT